MTYEIKDLWILFPTPSNLPYLEFGVKSYARFSKALSSSEFLRIVALVTTSQNDLRIVALVTTLQSSLKILQPF